MDIVGAAAVDDEENVAVNMDTDSATSFVGTATEDEDDDVDTDLVID